MNAAPGFGPRWLPRGGARFSLFAPGRDRVLLRLRTRAGATALPRAMERDARGWHVLECADCEPGDRYAFDLGDLTVPDPASRYQPEGVHGPSELVDLGAHAWRARWQGRPWHEAVVYELHVGTFSPEGNWAGLEARLDHLAGLGITAIELMPLAQFSGRRGWGYDGVLPYAPHAAYGRPEDLQRCIDAAHERGLMVLLDVVYNHFGPDGFYISTYWPRFFDQGEHTPWGAAINYGGAGHEEVREYVIGNAEYWLREFRFDGLRFDAVHAIRDHGDPRLLAEMAERLRAAATGREVHLVVENEDNEPALLDRDAGARRYTAQWNDDVHHGLHVALTGEEEGYYADYRPRPELLPRALAEGFGFQGEYMHARDGTRGAPSAHVPPASFVDFLQNHDQIGNRAMGERLTALAPRAAIDAALTLLLLGPHVPMLFMGEEWGTTRPFRYFCDFPEPLASAVRDGRRREFAHFAAFADPAAREAIPDPLDPATFEACVLDWQARDSKAGRARLERVRDLLALRAREIVPWLAGCGRVDGSWQVQGTAFAVTWRGGGRTLAVRANLADSPAELRASPGAEFARWGEADENGLGPWAVHWSWLDA
jgi:malto-oligosyltrehalose trehalohydrolase